MHTEIRFGFANKPKKAAQSLYIRIKHSNLDWNKSLKIKIQPEDWNFKKREIITHKTFNNPIHSQALTEISETVFKLTHHLKYKAESHYHTNYNQIKQWVKNKERKLFMDLCDKWYSEYYTKTEVIIQPTFMEAFEECREDLAETKHDSWTAGRWTNIGENIQQYMDIRKRDIRTDEFSRPVWRDMVKFFRKEYQHRDKTGNVGLADGSITTILKKIRAVKNHLGNKYKFHYDMDRLELKVKSKGFHTLTDSELESLWESSGEATRIHANEIKKWFFKIQYYGCFRISEVYKNLIKNPDAKKPRLKTPREIWENEVYLSKDANGNDIRVWKCYHAKDKRGNGSKHLPIHSDLARALFGNEYDQDIFPDTMQVNGKPIHELFTSATQLRFMKRRLKKLGIPKVIKSHGIRKSFITNQLKKGVQKSDLMQYSGHKSEAAFNLYINADDNYIPTQVDLG